MLRRFLAFGPMALTFLMLVAGASALPIGTGIDFSSGTLSGGALDYTPAPGNSLSISNAPVAFVQQFPSSQKFAITGGLLDLVTGPCFAGCFFNSTSHTTNSFFSDGGMVEIFGSLPELPGDPNGLLFEGTFNHLATFQGHAKCQFTSVNLNANTGKGGMGGCIMVTFLNPTLVTDLKLKGDIGKGFLSTMEFQLAFVNGQWTGEILSSDLDVKPVPEPASLALLGTGLILLGGAIRNRTKNARDIHRAEELG